MVRDWEVRDLVVIDVTARDSSVILIAVMELVIIDIAVRDLVVIDSVGEDMVKLSSYVISDLFMPSSIRIDSARVEVKNTVTSPYSISTPQYLSLGTNSALLGRNKYAS